MSIDVPNPFTLFGEWLAEASASEPNDPNAMALSTVGADGMPSCRMVLLKDFDEHGFVFYTNLGSQKAHELAVNPKAALLFHWKSLQRQVRVQGAITPVSKDEADAYFASRARDSRIGAWASKQSQPMEGRWELEKRVAAYALKFGIGEIPRPDFWSGFRVTPEVIEFWKAGAFRLHDRVKLERQADGDWSRTPLFP
ncbi:pyridoxamine 5'-phosphate oxidase [Niveibacterium sp. 24ML]|uniref:pyridoxamine 5'-phosphate oxidase n=1 Tax=Niveibacterium sp. 24ML TaxID=2985512 RepID=UPI00227118CA|nr:pyridoxamine 5'-phosphate oxidase [Niveibacterium sp. 24ML]MCX9157426.1 pyridoxamine 5'-phosphate oxidase [Niveibacterium sp. 24ML]